MTNRTLIHGILRLVLYWSVVLVVAALPSMAQTTTAVFLGTITDATGGVLAGAQVTASNVETGMKRTAATNAEGRFQLGQLPPGAYEVTVTMAGFETLIRTGMTLAVGQQANLALALKVGAVNQQVTVTGEAPIVETTQSSVSGVVEEKRITDLPLNGRDFTQLALVEPAVVSLRNTTTGEISKGFGTRISVAGSRADQTSWLLDGINIKGSTQFGTPGSAGGGLMGVDGVREFQVLTTNYSSEFGGTSGGVVNMVTKSGTNQFHGTAYEFLRNSTLDARNFFDQAKPAFKRNQFGFSLGGPIRKDKTFFFGNYEGLRQPQGVTNIAQVLDVNAHQGLVPVRGVLQQFPIAPSTAPFLNLLPLPNGPADGTGLATLISPASTRTSENYFMARVDHRLSDRQSLFTRFTYDQADLNNPDLIPVDNVLIKTSPRYATVQLVSIWTPKLLSATRLGYTRNFIALGETMNVNYPKSTFFLNQQYPPELMIPGATNFGPDSSNIQSAVQTVYQIQEGFTYTPGNHAFKFGADIQKLDPNIDGGPNNNGMFRWGSIQEFLTDSPLTQLSTALPGASSQRSFRQMLYGFYFADDWKMNPSFTWNLGLRYEPYTGPTEKWGRISVVKDWLTATHYDTGGQFFSSPGNKYFAPRIGFAWDPQGNGKMAVRGGFGLFYAPITTYNYNRQATRNAPFSGAITQPTCVLVANVCTPGTGTFATSLADIARIAPAFLTPRFVPGVTSPLILQYHPNAAYETKVNLAVERQLGQSVSLSAGYVGGRGYHLTRQIDINGRYPTKGNRRSFVDRNAPLPNAAFFQGQEIYTDAQSFYNGLRVQLKKRLSHGFQVQGSYTWSKSIDDATAGSGNTNYPTEGSSSQMWGTKADRGLSALDQRNNLVVNGLWSVPAPAGSRVASAVLGGWQVSGIFTAVAGTPFTAVESGTNVQDNGKAGGNSRLRMPDWMGGRSFSSISQGTTNGCGAIKSGTRLGTPNLWFDPCAFVLPPSGFYGNLGRGTFIGPGVMNLDMTLGKNIPLRFREGGLLEFRSDFFNLFNRANFAAPLSQVLNGNNGAPIGSAGQITRTVTSSRELQFSLKLVF